MPINQVQEAQPARELTADELVAVGGGFNPQPDPPGARASLRG